MADPYTHYLDGTYGTLQTREEAKALMQTATPAHCAETVYTDTNGTLCLTVPQTENQADLLLIEKATA
jgi:hypothetical protein